MHALIVAGPTCSGKSALALELARALDGVVINADSMQVYRELRVLTARPTPAEEAMVPHALYGVRPAAEPGSAAWWRDAAMEAIARAEAAGQLPILCGGTGMYFSALRDGLAEIPAPSEAARREARDLLAAEGAARLHARLMARDPETAATLRVSDGQRLARAWEVLVSTGRGLSAWQSDARPVGRGRFTAILLDPPRAELRQAIRERFAAMLEHGAVDEVRALLALDLDPRLPAMRAHGVPDLIGHLRGGLTLDEAASRAVLASGQYTRRQATWFRNRPVADPERTHTIHARFAGLTQFPIETWASVISFVREGG